MIFGNHPEKPFASSEVEMPLGRTQNSGCLDFTRHERKGGSRS